MAGALAIGLPALVLSRLIAFTGEPELQPVVGALIFGIGIVGAAFLLAWAAEVAELDISQALALAFVAFVAVLPEYAVDIYLAWQAGADPGSEYAFYAAANMTGGNRLLVGLGWSVVVLDTPGPRVSRSSRMQRTTRMSGRPAPTPDAQREAP